MIILHIDLSLIRERKGEEVRGKTRAHRRENIIKQLKNYQTIFKNK